ncbi:MAG: hypothetical protein DRR04_14860 [Gammaproteobacteria bacterium]|nr:MAG: hypothetical protein DRR04_14860 [Gammaproteobacteria bacterium]
MLFQMIIKLKVFSKALVVLGCCLGVGFAAESSLAESSKSLDDVRERLETPFMKGLLTATYQNFIQRIQPDGYLRESLTGAYGGMFPRTSGSMGQLLIETGELDKLESALSCILNSMLENDMERIPHIIGPRKSRSIPIPEKDNPGCSNWNGVFSTLVGDFGAVQGFVGRAKPLMALEVYVGVLNPGDTLVAEIYDSKRVRQAVATRIFDLEVQNNWERLKFSSPVKLIAGEEYQVMLRAKRGAPEVPGYPSTHEPIVFGGAIPKDMDMLEAGRIEDGKYISTNKSLAMVFDYGDLKHTVEPSRYRLICGLDEIDGQLQVITTWAMLAVHRGETDFENKTYPIMAQLMDRSTTGPYLRLGEESRWRSQVGLVCNVALEHSRDAQLWHTYDILTQSFACSALGNMIAIARRRQDTESADRWAWYLKSIEKNVMRYMTRDFEGKKIFYEMLLPTGREPKPFDGMGWLNLAPLAAGWKGVDQDVFKNTIDTWHRVAAIDWDGPGMTSSDWLPEGQIDIYFGKSIPNQVIGKALGWDLVYCFRAHEYDRVCDMLDFLGKNSSTGLFAESFFYNPQSKIWSEADPGNGEQVAWWWCAMVNIRGEVGLTPLP